MRSVLLQLVEVAGAVSVVYGLSLLAPWLAFVVGGAAAVAAAALLDDGKADQ